MSQDGPLRTSDGLFTNLPVYLYRYLVGSRTCTRPPVIRSGFKVKVSGDGFDKFQPGSGIYLTGRLAPNIEVKIWSTETPY